MSDAPASEPDRSGGSPLVALATVGAATMQLLFLKGCAVFLDLPAFGTVQVALSLGFATTFTALALRATSADRASDVPGGLDHAARFHRLLVRIGGLSVGASILFALLPLHEWLSLPSPMIAALMPLVGGAGVLYGMASGTVLGLGRDRAFAALLIFEPMLRCLLAALLFSIGFGGDGFGPALAMAISLASTAMFARAMIRPRAAPPAATTGRRRPRHQPLATPAAIAALIAYGTLLALDLPLSRVALGEELASRYAGIAVASRFLVLLPVPLSLLLMTRLRGLGVATRPVKELWRLLVGAVVGYAVLLLLLNEFGQDVLELVLHEDDFGGLKSAYVGYALAQSLNGLSQLLIFFGIALGHVSLVMLPAAVAIVQIPVFLSNASTIGDCVSIVQTMAIMQVGALAVVVLLPRLVRQLAVRARQAQPPQ